MNFKAALELGNGTRSGNYSNEKRGENLPFLTMAIGKAAETEQQNSFM